MAKKECSENKTFISSSFSDAFYSCQQRADLKGLTLLLYHEPKLMKQQLLLSFHGQKIPDTPLEMRPYLKQLVSLKQEERNKAFIDAASENNIDTLLRLEEFHPDNLQDMISADDYAPYRYAAEEGHVPVLCYLEKKVGDHLDEMFKAEAYYAFFAAAGSGHFKVIHHFEKKFPLFFQSIPIHIFGYAINNAAMGGHIPMIKYLDQIAPGHYDKMTASGDYSPFLEAFSYGQLQVLKFLEKRTSDEMFQQMIQSLSKSSMINSIGEGYYDMLSYVTQKSKYALPYGLNLKPLPQTLKKKAPVGRGTFHAQSDKPPLLLTNTTDSPSHLSLKPIFSKK